MTSSADRTGYRLPSCSPLALLAQALQSAGFRSVVPNNFLQVVDGVTGHGVWALDPLDTLDAITLDQPLPVLDDIARQILIALRALRVHVERIESKLAAGTDRTIMSGINARARQKAVVIHRLPAADARLSVIAFAHPGVESLLCIGQPVAPSLQRLLLFA